MPKMRRHSQSPTPACLAALAWLLCTGMTQAQTPAPDRAQGLRLMTERGAGNCLACHAIPGQAGVQSDFGPALAGVATRYTEVQLRQWVTDARVLRPNTLMPPFGSTTGLYRPNPEQPVLTPTQIDQVVVALQSLR